MHALTGDETQSLQARIEQLTVLQSAGDNSGAARIAGAARRLAERSNDQRALCELDLLATTRAIEAGDTRRALASARSAREHALEATDPMLYTGAAIAVAELAETRGDDLGAYESLAMGWVTLADLLGRDLARQTFAGALQGLRERIGVERFAAAKSAYEQARHAKLAGAEGRPTSQTNR